jgi:hypothetical protein
MQAKKERSEANNKRTERKMDRRALSRRRGLNPSALRLITQNGREFFADRVNAERESTKVPEIGGIITADTHHRMTGVYSNPASLKMFVWILIIDSKTFNFSI